MELWIFHLMKTKHNINRIMPTCWLAREEGAFNVIVGLHSMPMVFEIARMGALYDRDSHPSHSQVQVPHGQNLGCSTPDSSGFLAVDVQKLHHRRL